MYLNYTEQEGLFISPNKCCPLPIESHEDKGYNAKLAEQTLTIPNKGFSVLVKTNFGYGLSSYHYANITFLEDLVLNFCNTKNLCKSIQQFFVEPGDWEGLFKQIIHVYDHICCLHTDKEINDYFDKVDCFIQTDFLKNNSLRARKLIEIIDAVSKSIYKKDTRVQRRLLTSCKLYIKQICQNIETIRNLPSENPVFESLLIVHEYLYHQNCTLALFDAIKSECIE